MIKKCKCQLYNLSLQCRNYSRYDDEPSSLYVSSSPDVNDRTRLTTAVASPATSSRSSRLALEEFGVETSAQRQHPNASNLGSSIGGIGGSLLRGSKGRTPERGINPTELDLRRQTTVRLLRSGSPESAC